MSTTRTPTRSAPELAASPAASAAKHTRIKIVPLGAGQDVGRSCVLISMGGKNIMLDCGMHMGYTDERRFPDFTYISKTGKYTDMLDCVIISHFHLDHCGALPYFTEVCGFDGPIYMTYPTKAICPILLEDMRKVVVERKGDTNFFTSQDVKNCMKKVIPVDLHEIVRVDDELEIKAYYAGHVLGAAMFHIRVGNQSVVYTGDYNMTPDRHLGAAWIDRCRPDVLITETTYATTIRDSKRARERDFLKKVHDCVNNGGKVLIPVFALGRAQELCILIEGYWERMALSKVPVYFSAGLTERANEYYKLFINWTNQKIKNTFVERNMFDFKHIGRWESSLAEEPGPMVLFATPGMLHAGTSLEVFKKWCHDERNMVILPGYCVAGTVGAKVLAGEKVVEVDKWTKVNVNMSVKNLSFSAHADAKGIMQLVRMCEPRNVILVHGEKKKMGFLKQRMERELGIPTYDPANGATITLQTSLAVPVKISRELIRKAYLNARPTPKALFNDNGSVNVSNIRPVTAMPFEGVLTYERGTGQVKLYDCEEAEDMFGVSLSTSTTSSAMKRVDQHMPSSANVGITGDSEVEYTLRYNPIPFLFESNTTSFPPDIPSKVMDLCLITLSKHLFTTTSPYSPLASPSSATSRAPPRSASQPVTLHREKSDILARSVRLSHTKYPETAVLVRWREDEDGELARKMIAVIKAVLK
ncbi:Integrator complex subunit 11 [Quaeritorhiza haematococci]|nr:Integrator complex subunit 11 [Quaeritorhiza haematococci]